MLFYAPPFHAPHFFIKYLHAHDLITHLPEAADYLVLPFMYEVIFDYIPEKLHRAGVTTADLPGMKAMALELDGLSVKLNKQLIVFFYRDPVDSLPFANALVFRTSGYASQADAGTFGLPAFVEGKPGNSEFNTHVKKAVPHVSFFGNAAPLKLAVSVALRDKANSTFAKFGFSYRVKNFQPAGYLLRRRALLSCRKGVKTMHTHFRVNPNGTGPGYSKDYLRSFCEADYFICAAGFGNYAYRLYETMREGRIPVYIDTDALMPCADKIDWKKLMVWVPATHVDRTADFILDFHAGIHPDDFFQLQHTLRQTYYKYLTPKGFAAYLVGDFLPAFLNKPKSLTEIKL